MIGDNQPTYVVAEIGINHNGDLEKARQLIDVAAHPADAEIPKRTPELCVPPTSDQKRGPLGHITYLAYRKR
jgi:N-acetylneuraminate synthase